MLGDDICMLVKDEEAGRAARREGRSARRQRRGKGRVRRAAVEGADEFALLETGHGGGGEVGGEMVLRMLSEYLLAVSSG